MYNTVSSRRSPKIWGGEDLGDHECLNFSSMRDVGSDTEIDHRATAIDRGSAAIRNFRLNEVLLVFIILLEVVRQGNQTKISRRTLNISSSFSFETTRRSNFCFSFIALSETFSSAG